jgi:hypothetical protein
VRTTLTLDDDVTHLLNKEMRRSGASFKETVNHFLRVGLTASGKPARRPFVVTPRRMGLPPGLSYDNVAELLEVLEGPARK